MPFLTGTTNKSYISSIALLDERELLDQVLDTTSEDATIVDIFELTGRMVQTDQITYYHKTNDYVFRSGTISAVDATNNGERVASVNETLVLTLTTDEELPIVGETALLKNKKQGFVSAVNTGTRVVTISPFDNTTGKTLNPGGTEILATQKVTFFSAAYGEGTDDPSSKRPTFKTSSNQIQIFKTAREITDIQKVSTVEVNYGGKRYILYKMQHDCLLEHRAKIAYQFLIGQRATTTDANGNTVWRTQGLREYILNGDGVDLTTGGNNIALTTTITLANLRAMSRALDKRGAGDEYWFWTGGDLSADLDEVLTGLEGVKNGIVYNSWGIGDGQKKALDLGVDSFKIYDRTFHKKKIKAYDHPEVFAPSTDFNFGSEGYLIPAGKIPVDASGNKIDALRTRFMAGDGTDLKWNEFRGGRLADPKTESKAVLKFSYESVMGLEAVGIRQFGIFSKA